MKSLSIILVFVLFGALSLSAQFNPLSEQEQNTMRPAFAGKWQEYQRAQGKKKRRAQTVEITDTMQLQFMLDSNVRIWFSNGRYFNERFYNDRAGLHFGERFRFNFYEFDGDELTLRDATTNTWHSFSAVDELEQGAIKKLRPGIEQGAVDISSANLKGTWSVYKKEDKNFSGTKFYLRTLKILEVTEGNLTVQASQANMSTAKPNNGTGTIDESVLSLSLDSETLSYNILKLNASEMILSRDGVVLFLRNFAR